MQEQRTRDLKELRQPTPIADRPATDEDIEQFKAAVLAKLTAAIGKDPPAATGRDWFFATVLAARSDHSPLAGGRPREPRPRAQAHLLPVARVSDRPPAT